MYGGDYENPNKTVLGGVTDTTKKAIFGFIVFLVIVLCIQYYIHTQYMNMKTNPITGEMVNKDPPMTIFRFFEE